MNPKFTDKRRYTLPYVPVAQQGEGYLKRRFAEIEQAQKEQAAARLKNLINIKRGQR